MVEERTLQHHHDEEFVHEHVQDVQAIEHYQVEG